MFVHLMHFPVYSLGPGRRAGLWLQGCSLRCRGCVTPESWEFEPRCAVHLDDVTDRLHRFWSASPPPSGLTVSGGEPFDQPEALLELLRRARGFGAGDILIYSGYRADILLERHPELRDLASALVDGPFEAGNVTESIWKGSENQSLTLLEERLSSRYEDWTRGKARKLQLVKSGDRDLLIGVPRQADVALLRKPDLSQET